MLSIEETEAREAEQRMPMNDENRRILALKAHAIEHFTEEDWQNIGLLTNSTDYINHHPRFLRSLSFDDQDYGGHVATVLREIVVQEPGSLAEMEEYVRIGSLGDAVNISSVRSLKSSINFTPSVFDVPSEPLEPRLISVMMPFSMDLGSVYEHIGAAAADAGFSSLRADDIWVHSAVIQDVFSLIFRSFIVVCDFSVKNPNVFYEAGIAHTLGKHVIPITQTMEDIPFDLRHHRALTYLNNNEGRQELRNRLCERFRSLDVQR